MTIYRLHSKPDPVTNWRLEDETTELGALIEDAFEMAVDEYAVQITHNDENTDGDYVPGLVVEFVESVQTNLRAAVELHRENGCEGC
jgi:hypothetical protein